MIPCRTCGGDRYGPEPDSRLAYVRYSGSHPEPSISFPVPCPGLAVRPFAEQMAMATGVGSHRNEILAMPRGRWMRVSVWAAVFLAGARERHGPWVHVRLTVASWREVQARAPWLRNARRDAVLLMNPEFLDAFRRCEVNTYSIG